jgi:hypothetical protein
LSGVQDLSFRRADLGHCFGIVHGPLHTQSPRWPGPFFPVEIYSKIVPSVGSQRSFPTGYRIAFIKNNIRNDRSGDNLVVQFLERSVVVFCCPGPGVEAERPPPSSQSNRTCTPVGSWPAQLTQSRRSRCHGGSRSQRFLRNSHHRQSCLAQVLQTAREILKSAADLSALDLVGGNNLPTWATGALEGRTAEHTADSNRADRSH